MAQIVYHTNNKIGDNVSFDYTTGERFQNSKKDLQLIKVYDCVHVWIMYP